MQLVTTFSAGLLKSGRQPDAARAALATADRLSRLGFDRGRGDLVPSPETRGERKAVEITVAGSAPGR